MVHLFRRSNSQLTYKSLQHLALAQGLQLQAAVPLVAPIENRQCGMVVGDISPFQKIVFQLFCRSIILTIDGHQLQFHLERPGHLPAVGGIGSIKRNCRVQVAKIWQSA